MLPVGTTVELDTGEVGIVTEMITKHYARISFSRGEVTSGWVRRVLS